MCLSLCMGPIQAIIQDITTPDIRSTAIGLVLLLGHLLGDASSPLIIGRISDISYPLGWVSNASQSLGFALLITAPASLFLAGLICLIGLKTVAGDIKAMQEQLHTDHE